MKWLGERAFDDLVKIVTAASAFAVAFSFVYAVLVRGVSATWKTSLGEFIVDGSVPGGPTPGERGKPRANSNQTVWESTCPADTIPISGSCVAQSPGVPLQNIGPSGQKWECAWFGPMPKADVRAVCLKTK